MVEQSHDLEGNIQLDTFDQDEESKQPASGQNNGFRSENDRPNSSASSQMSAGETFNTLDEPVSETIVSRQVADKVLASFSLRELA